jgi:hypothetical protein
VHNRNPAFARVGVIAGVCILLLALLLQLGLSTYRNSITWDEDNHIYSGYMFWKTRDFGLKPEHSPLVKLFATLPLLPMDLKLPAMEDRNFKVQGFLGGKDFLFRNDADTMLFRARMPASILPSSGEAGVFGSEGNVWNWCGIRFVGPFNIRSESGSTRNGSGDGRLQRCTHFTASHSHRAWAGSSW